MVPLLLDSMPGSMSPDGVDSSDIADSVVYPPIASTSCQLPTIDESLDFLIERLSKAGGKAVDVEL
ncbi:hypothetical protein PF006_g30647 [Phytophthora fragariae]|nr:hypothetical protein PF006_g30647 [Phytophthora fragariae]